MNANKILFPTDFSHTGDAALAMATSLARDTGAKLLIVHVKEPPLAYNGEMYYGALEPDMNQLEDMLEEIVPTDSNVPFEHRLLIGDPVNELVRLAQEEHVDLIVMATHGRTGLTRLLLGSVAEAVVRKAPCPVMTFKQPADQPAKTE